MTIFFLFIWQGIAVAAVAADLFVIRISFWLASVSPEREKSGGLQRRERVRFLRLLLPLASVSV